MENLTERLTGQLDSLVPFLELSRDQVFSLVQAEYEGWVSRERQTTLPANADIHRTQVSHAAFLLGFSYFEAFVADTIRLLLRNRPVMLPREKKVTFGEILDLPEPAELIEFLVEREVRDVMFGSLDSVRKYFSRRLNVEWPAFPRLAEAAAIRNSIIHNLSRASDALVAVDPRWSPGQEIALVPADVHSFGLAAREFVREFWPLVERQITLSKSELDPLGGVEPFPEPGQK